jgi:kynurenine 3-monooxygenase
MQTSKKIAVVGSGLVRIPTGCYLHKAGHTVHVMTESDIRQIQFSGRSIGLCLAGLESIKWVE